MLDVQAGSDAIQQDDVIMNFSLSKNSCYSSFPMPRHTRVIPVVVQINVDIFDG